MKKSFLLTVAAFSTAALIGCSSSSDDNSGTPPGPKDVTVSVAPFAKTADTKWLVSKVTVKNTEGADVDASFTVKCNDAELTKEQLVIENKMIAVAKEQATTANKCKVVATGDYKGESAEITYTEDEAKYTEKTPASVVFTNEEGKDVEKFELTKKAKAEGESGAAANKPEFTFKSGKKEGTVAVDAASSKITVTAENITEITKAELAGVSDVTVKYEESKAKFDLTNTKNAINAEANKVVAFTYDNDKTVSLPITVTIEGEEQKPVGKTPSLDETKKDYPLIKGSTHTVAFVKDVPDGYVAKCATAAELGAAPFQGVTDKTEDNCKADLVFQKSVKNGADIIATTVANKAGKYGVVYVHQTNQEKHNVVIQGFNGVADDATKKDAQITVAEANNNTEVPEALTDVAANNTIAEIKTEKHYYIKLAENLSKVGQVNGTAVSDGLQKGMKAQESITFEAVKGITAELKKTDGNSAVDTNITFTPEGCDNNAKACWVTINGTSNQVKEQNAKLKINPAAEPKREITVTVIGTKE